MKSCESKEGFLHLAYSFPIQICSEQLPGRVPGPSTATGAAGGVKIAKVKSNLRSNLPPGIPQVNLDNLEKGLHLPIS